MHTLPSLQSTKIKRRFFTTIPRPFMSNKYYRAVECGWFITIFFIDVLKTPYPVWCCIKTSENPQLIWTDCKTSIQDSLHVIKEKDYHNCQYRACDVKAACAGLETPCDCPTVELLYWSVVVAYFVFVCITFGVLIYTSEQV